ncbi:MAG: hypothetical protein AAF725_12400, partial [Acidobacteriota bacterium]
MTASRSWKSVGPQALSSRSAASARATAAARAARSGLLGFVLCSLAGLPATETDASPQGGGEGPELFLSDGSQVIQSLPVGGDLWVFGRGLPGQASVDVVLLGDTGQQILRRQALTSASGVLEARRLWSRTGIGGCDCEF